MYVKRTNDTMAKIVVQDYPRIKDPESKFHGYLDDSTLSPHRKKLPPGLMKKIIISSINAANKKSGREILNIPKNAKKEEIEKIYEKEGRKLFKYFKKYCGDPASSAHQILGKNYREVGIEQFRNRTLQKERMNSGWRYQYLAKDCATHSKRFKNVSDIGAAEADFNAVIEFADKNVDPLSLYVSIKNRVNTMGGQDWPKAIHALENVANNDKNRTGSYCCVFGIAMDRGLRNIKRSQKNGVPYSYNTEIWLSDFFWPFFANYTYEEIMTAVLEVLIEYNKADDLSTQIEAPDTLLEAFGASCMKAGLTDSDGNFNDAFALVRFFCNK